MTGIEDEKTRISIPAPLQTGPKNSSLVQIYGPNLGQRYIIDQPTLSLGRDESNDIVLADENVSRHHAEIIMGDEITLVDQESTNGSRVNDDEIRKAVLANGDLIQIGSFILKYISSGNAEAIFHETIYNMTITDGLTEVANRRKLEEFLERELAGAIRHKRPLSVAVIDADHFKAVNDNFGHIAGDYVLRRLAHVIQGVIRKDELLARYGGEEFVIVMPESTLQQASVLAEKVRKLIEETKFHFEEHTIPVTVSVGVANHYSKLQDVDAFIKAADEALYRAKETGRNRVCNHEPK
ncbi:MAG: diguanylate cyclase [Deltaproteobacteria bacterium]|mgnify:CR=1 FL=1|nr:diguanylate cyclase [Deltaproteobacteria bacterium]MBT6435807.1 diguanylate cyclase [Deltaproteobacteria bacterium]